MTKTKKIIIGALAAGLIATTTCIAASASTDSTNLEVPGNNAYFEWNAGYAKVTNTRDSVRWAGTNVKKVNSRTGETTDSDPQSGAIGYYDFIDSEVHNATTNGYHYDCEGIIYAGGSHNTPVDSTFSKRYPQ